MIRFQSPQLPSVEAIAAYFARSEAIRRYSNRGPCHELLAERLSDYLGGLHCVPVANATLGLMLGLRALVGDPVGARREVLVPSFTFAATINAILWAGLQPVFVDVEEESWHLDPASLGSALTRRGDQVAAVLACSTFGIPPPAGRCKAWEDLAQRAKIPLVVDSAAGFGAIAGDGVMLGRQGDVEIFSFHATKPFAIGEGGVVTTADDGAAAQLARLTNFGFQNGVVDSEVGLNAKLSEWSAATALAVLDIYPDICVRRQRLAEEMIGGLRPHGYGFQAGSEGAVWQFVPTIAPSRAVRDRALEAAREAGIELRTYFSVPLHRMPAFSSVPAAGSLRCTEKLADHALSLPMSNDLSARDLALIVDCLAGASRSATGRRETFHPL